MHQPWLDCRHREGRRGGIGEVERGPLARAVLDVTKSLSQGVPVDIEGDQCLVLGLSRRNGRKVRIRNQSGGGKESVPWCGVGALGTGGGAAAVAAKTQEEVVCEFEHQRRTEPGGGMESVNQMNVLVSLFTCQTLHLGIGKVMVSGQWPVMVMVHGCDLNSHRLQIQKWGAFKVGIRCHWIVSSSNQLLKYQVFRSPVQCTKYSVGPVPSIGGPAGSALGLPKSLRLDPLL